MTPGRPRPTFAHKLAYAAGQAGNVLGYQMIGQLVLPLYRPPDGQGFHALIPPAAAGIAMFVPRAVDTFFDPYLANVSDRSTSRLGRRRLFMLIGFAPLGIATGLAFYPPTDVAGLLNAVYLAVVLTAYNCLFSVYVGPYLALLPELFPDKNENTQVSTLQAAAALFGAALVGGALLFVPEHDPDRSGLKLVTGVLAAISLLLLAVPVVAVDERKYVHRVPGAAASHKGPFASLAATFRERAFVPYVLGSMFYWIGFTILNTAAPMFVEVLLRRPLRDLLVVEQAPLLVCSALFFFAVPPLQRRLGKRKLMLISSLGFAALMGVGVPLLPSMPWLAQPLFMLAGISVALFLAVPNAMLADVCEANARKTGERREGMFFGAQGFLQKFAVGTAAAGVSWVAELFGKSSDSPLGVQLSGPLAAVALLASAACFWRYPEESVLADTAGAAPPSEGAPDGEPVAVPSSPPNP